MWVIVRQVSAVPAVGVGYSTGQVSAVLAIGLGYSTGQVPAVHAVGVGYSLASVCCACSRCGLWSGKYLLCLQQVRVIVWETSRMPAADEGYSMAKVCCACSR